ncbi:MAG: Cof-type HAD-IIB family hydrolase [Butyricicoccaceae bacterium]
MAKFDGVLLASDMDFTLLSTDRTISRENIEALEYFTQNGGSFALCTGRTRPATEQYRKILPMSGPSIYLNGALIVDESTETVIHMDGLDERAKEIARTVMEKFPWVGIEVFLYDHSYVCQMNQTAADHFEHLAIPYQQMDLDEIPESTDIWGKINFVGPHDPMAAVHEYLEPEQKHYNLTYSTPIFYEMTHQGGDKGTGVLRAAELAGIRPEHVYTVGDNYNDLPMLKVAKLAFVPSNGAEDALALADVVVSSNDDHALRDVVQHLDQIYSK